MQLRQSLQIVFEQYFKDTLIWAGFSLHHVSYPIFVALKELITENCEEGYTENTFFNQIVSFMRI